MSGRERKELQRELQHERGIAGPDRVTQRPLDHPQPIVQRIGVNAKPGGGGLAHHARGEEGIERFDEVSLTSFVPRQQRAQHLMHKTVDGLVLLEKIE